MGILLVLLLLLNFGISWWNATVAGKVWNETSIMGGWMRLVTWSTVVMSAVGFTFVFAIIGAFTGNAFFPEYVPNAAIEAIVSLTYVMIIVPFLGSGLVITIHSWIQAYRERDFASMAVAGWNTGAMAYDTVNAFSAVPDALGKVSDFFKPDSDDDLKSFIQRIVLYIVVLAVLSGILLTAWIVKRNIGTLPIPALPDMPKVENRQQAYR